jgi:hypothetical protein
MASTDLARVMRRARLHYEWGRARRAIAGFAPVLALIMVAAHLGHRPTFTWMIGALLFIAGTSILWYGRDLRRAVLPGVFAGIVPLTLALCANHFGHVCTGDRCMTLCVPACTLGGLLAGLAVAAVGHARRQGFSFWATASLLALLTGAMGCACVGYSGMAGLALGFGGASLPALVHHLRGPRRG